MAVQLVKVQAEKREALGSRANKRLRDAGRLPGVVYGHKQEVLPVSFNRKEMATAISKGAHIFELSIAGKTENALLKEAQFDHLGIELIHLDLARVSLDEKVEVRVPLVLKGTPKGEADGGVLQQILTDIEIECRVLDMPESIVHNVSELELDSVLHIKDLKLPEGVKALQDGELIVATVREILEEAAAPATAEGAAEPEVIGKKAEEAAEGEEKAEKK
jgi:large subunit ribosomal protein L25